MIAVKAPVTKVLVLGCTYATLAALAQDGWLPFPSSAKYLSNVSTMQCIRLIPQTTIVQNTVNRFKRCYNTQSRFCSAVI
jgi:hypothetical protein